MRTFGLLLSAALMVASVSASADTLVVGVEQTPYYPVYQYQDGKYTGAAAEILDAFAAASGHAIDYKAFPIPRLYKTFVEGGVDFKFPDNEKWQGEVKAGVKVAYSDPVITYIDGAVVLAERKTDDVSKLRTLGIPLGFTPFEYRALIADGKVTVSENPNFAGLIQQLLAGRIDGAYASIAVINYEAKRLNQEGAVAFAPNMPHTRDAYRLSTIKRPEILAQFNKWLADNAATVSAIKAKYGAEAGF